MNTSPKTRLRRALTTVVATLALAMPTTVALLASPQAAYAGNGNSSDSGGPQGTGTSADSNSSGTDTECRAGNLWKKSGGDPWILNHPNCAANGWSASGQPFEICQAGYQVFRFYGTKRSPAAGWTTSMINQDSWCLGAQQDQQKYAFWSTSGYDAGGGDSDVARTNTNNTADQAAIFKPVWRSEHTQYQQYAAGQAFEAGGSCTTAQNPTNPLRKFLEDPTQPEEAKQLVAWKLVDLFNSRVASGENQSHSVQYAQKETGIASFVYSNPTNPRAGTVTVNWITAPCTSPMQYVSTATTSAGGNIDADRFTGYCYIPLMRYKQTYDKPKVSGKRYGYPTVNAGYGLRYSKYYKGAVYTPGQERDRNGNYAAPGSWDEQIINGWRDTMATWYGSHVTKDHYLINTKMRQLVDADMWQVYPADPYPQESGRISTVSAQRFNRDQAINALRNYSKCRFGTNYSFTADNTLTTDDTVDTTLNLVMENQPVFHAGGYIPGDAEQTVTITPRELTCTGAGCGTADPVLKALSYSVEVSLPDSYKRCDPGTAALNCDYAITDIQVGSRHLSCAGSTGPCQLQVSQVSDPADLKIGLVFFKPTSAADRVQVNISNVTATYGALKSARILKMTLFDASTGQAYVENVTIPAHEETQAVEHIAVSGAPVALRNDAGVFRFFAPVIGAISSR